MFLNCCSAVFVVVLSVGACKAAYNAAAPLKTARAITPTLVIAILTLREPTLLILPTHVGALRRSLLNMLRQDRHHTLQHGPVRLPVCKPAAAGVAVRLHVAVFKVGDAVWIFLAIEEVLGQVDGIVEIPAVHVTNGDVQFSDQL